MWPRATELAGTTSTRCSADWKRPTNNSRHSVGSGDLGRESRRAGCASMLIIEVAHSI